MSTKVAHLTSVHTPFDTRILLKECRTLAAAGYDVVLIAPHDRDEVIESVKIRAVPRPTNRIQRMLLTAYLVYRTARDEDPALYHIHDPELIPLAYLLHRRGHRVVFDMHENVPGSLVDKRWISPFMRKPVRSAYLWMERALMRDLPVIFAESSYAESYPWLQKSVIVLNLPNYDDLKDITSCKCSVFTAGYMGFVSTSRGCRVAVEALRILWSRRYTVHFECVGPYVDAEKREIDAMIDQHHLQDVRFHGRLAQHDGWRLMAGCHVGLAVLKPSANYTGSYPTKMFEYMALGLPVVVSDFPLYRSVVERAHCGICVDPNDPQRLADVLLYLHDNPDVAQQMGANGKSYVEEKMNWDTEAPKLIEFYSQVLNENG